jgi:GT2 family glycosyltransferase
MIFVVLPTFNRKESLLRCLECLGRQDVSHRVVISDSGSTDGTSEAVSKAFPEALVLEGHADLFWTGAVNLALRWVADNADSDDFFLLLNDDTEFGPGYLKVLLSCAAEDPKRIVGSVCTDLAEPRKILGGGIRINWWTGKFVICGHGKTLDQYPHGFLRVTSAQAGRATLYPVSVLSDVGFPNEEKLPHYGGDFEFSRRCSKHGYSLLVSYDAVVMSKTVTDGFRKGRQSARNFFFSKKSLFNLRSLYWFARLSTKNPLKAGIYYLCNVARVIRLYLKTI